MVVQDEELRADSGAHASGAPRVGLLVACYGTSDPARAQASVVGLARSAREALCRTQGIAASELPSCVAFTSAKVRRKLAAAGAPVSSVAEAFDRLRAAGVREVVVASSHLVDGGAYAKVRAAAEEAAATGIRVRLASPLLADMGDVCDLAGALAERYPAEARRTVVLVGHGAAGAGQFAYAALSQSLQMMGRADMLVGTLRGRPGVDDMLRALAPMAVRRVALVPLMLTAGAHAARDLAGAGPESWASRLRAAGYAVEVVNEGLAVLPVVQELMVRHLLAAAEVPALAAEVPAHRGGSGGMRRADAEKFGLLAPHDTQKPGFQVSHDAQKPGAGVPAGDDVAASAPVGCLANHQGSARFPLFVDLTGADCLVVGAGSVGARRARALARFGARVTVVDPRGWSDGVPEGDGEGDTGAAPVPGGIAVQQRAYTPGDEQGRLLVVAATSDRAVNRAIGARCRAAGIPVSVADAADECTFVFPALATAPGLVCGIVSTDNDHAHVARAARAVRDAMAAEHVQADAPSPGPVCPKETARAALDALSDSAGTRLCRVPRTSEEHQSRPRGEGAHTQADEQSPAENGSGGTARI